VVLVCSNDGGGGEKVLWWMVKVFAESEAEEVVVYSLEPSKEAILEKIKVRDVLLRQDSGL
jgi:hypothetical protein